MSASGAVSKIFFPAHVCSPRTLSGFLVGWNVGSFTTCVAAVISDVKLEELEATLSTLSTDNRYMSLVCGVSPSVLGFLIVNTGNEDSENILGAEGVSEKKKTANLWMTIQLQTNNMPSLRSVYFLGCPYSDLSSEFIFYKQPNPARLQYLSLEPLILDISKNGIDKVEQESTTLKNMKKITNPRIYSTWKQRHQMNDMDLVLNQINSSYEMEKAIITRCRSFLARRNRRSASVSETVKKSAVGLGIFLNRCLMRPIHYLALVVRPIIVHPVIYLLALIRVIAEIILWLLNLRLPNWFLNGIALKDLSATAQQIDLRLQQVCFWPWQYILLRDGTNTATTRAQYISFYNSLWLVANDIIIGVAIGSFLINNNEEMAKIITDDYLNHYTIERLEKMIIWLMGWPAGLKLNSELDKFLGELFLWLILLWKGCMTNIRPLTPTIIEMIGLSGILGASMVLSLLSDFLSFMTIHIYSFYMVAARIFNWQLTILYSLFNLFQGKKWNTLRNRIDSCDYDLDQLLLGTILFTLLTFLFPTVVVYYATFALSRVGVIFLQAVMETLLAFLNHFPLFAVMLRFKDPERLPGGLRFEICDPGYFATSRIPLARVVQGLKSFLPWSQNFSHRPALRTEFPFINEGSSTAVSKSPLNHLQVSQAPMNDIRFRKSRITISIKSSLAPLSSPGVSYLYMQNLPIPLSAIFFQYMLLWKRLSSHYLSFYVIRGLISGETIRPIPKLQYPMLPETRPTLMDFWLFLKLSFAVQDE